MKRRTPLWGVSSQPPDPNPFLCSCLPGFVAHYEWLHAHMREHSACISNIHSLPAKSLLGLGGADQEDGPREKSRAGLGSAPKILELWL